MNYHHEEAVLDRILCLLEGQRDLLSQKLSREDHEKFSEQSRQIQELLASLSRAESAGRG